MTVAPSNKTLLIPNKSKTSANGTVKQSDYATDMRTIEQWAKGVGGSTAFAYVLSEIELNQGALTLASAETQAFPATSSGGLISGTTVIPSVQCVAGAMTEWSWEVYSPFSNATFFELQFTAFTAALSDVLQVEVGLTLPAGTIGLADWTGFSTVLSVGSDLTLNISNPVLPTFFSAAGGIYSFIAEWISL